MIHFTSDRQQASHVYISWVEEGCYIVSPMPLHGHHWLALLTGPGTGHSELVGYQLASFHAAVAACAAHHERQRERTLIPVRMLDG